MKDSSTITRRHFLQSGLLGSTALAAASVPATLLAGAAKAERDPFDGLKIGMASYTLRNFSLDQAIAMTKQAGVKYICLKDMHLPLKSTTAERQAAAGKIQAAGLSLVGGGVIYMKNNEAELQRFFEYAKDVGMPTIICSPDIDVLDTVEKMAKRYDLRIAIHNHGPSDSTYPSPRDVLRLVKDRDSRLGICMDVGHTVRIGEDPVEAIQQCASRLYDFHIKDVTAASARGGPIQVGRGVIDIVAVLKALLKMDFRYSVNLEYEADAAAPMNGVIESYAYIRGVLAAL